MYNYLNIPLDKFYWKMSNIEVEWQAITYMRTTTPQILLYLYSAHYCISISISITYQHINIIISYRFPSQNIYIHTVVDINGDSFSKIYSHTCTRKFECTSNISFMRMTNILLFNIQINITYLNNRWFHNKLSYMRTFRSTNTIKYLSKETNTHFNS